jgi:WD40 repeat protein
VIVGAAAGSIVQEFQGHEVSVTSSAVSSDGARIVSSGDDRTVRVWDKANATAEVVARATSCWSDAQ